MLVAPNCVFCLNWAIIVVSDQETSRNLSAEFYMEEFMKEINRRSFLKTTTLLGASTLLGENFFWSLIKGPHKGLLLKP